MITGTQLRMARSALKWGVRELAAKAQVSPATITRIEADNPANAATLQALRTALENGGIEFIPENGGGPGVRLKKDHRNS
jgi:transcriptional regulator with XRE-family HTH domain